MHSTLVVYSQRVADVSLLVGSPDQLESDGAGGDVGREEGLLGHDPHVARTRHVEAGRVAEDLVGVLSAETQENKCLVK